MNGLLAKRERERQCEGPDRSWGWTNAKGTVGDDGSSRKRTARERDEGERKSEVGRGRGGVKNWGEKWPRPGHSMSREVRSKTNRDDETMLEAWQERTKAGKRHRDKEVVMAAARRGKGRGRSCKEVLDWQTETECGRSEGCKGAILQTHPRQALELRVS